MPRESSNARLSRAFEQHGVCTMVTSLIVSMRVQPERRFLLNRHACAMCLNGFAQRAAERRH